MCLWLACIALILAVAVATVLDITRSVGSETLTESTHAAIANFAGQLQAAEEQTQRVLRRRRTLLAQLEGFDDAESVDTGTAE